MELASFAFFFVVNGPAADTTDAPQPQGLLCNPCDEDEKDDQFFFSLFQVMEHQ
jgi:hypothetical protein